MFRRVCLSMVAVVCINFSALLYVLSTMKAHTSTCEFEPVSQSNSTQTLDYFCFKVQQCIEDEKTRLSENSLALDDVKLTPPDADRFYPRRHDDIPYLYSTWRSFANLPRRLTPCEHYIFMELLKILDRFFRRHQIEYMIVAGTLLGSYTHHDFLPWDDDVDMRVLIHDRLRMHRLLSRELNNVISVSNVTDQYGNYDKIYFPWSPRAGTEIWSYPYIDVFYYDTNATHNWRTDHNGQSVQNCSTPKHNVYPLVWRPFGRVWLPAPREPLAVFEMQGWAKLGQEYFASDYSHKHERTMPSLGGRARPEELHAYYPGVRRSCSEKYCTEALISVSNRTIHSIQFEKYRTELTSDPELGKKKCPL